MYSAADSTSYEWKSNVTTISLTRNRCMVNESVVGLSRVVAQSDMGGAAGRADSPHGFGYVHNTTICSTYEPNITVDGTSNASTWGGRGGNEK